MKHENCENCLVYDELMEGILAPCDEEGGMEAPLLSVI